MQVHNSVQILDCKVLLAETYDILGTSNLRRAVLGDVGNVGKSKLVSSNTDELVKEFKQPSKPTTRRCLIVLLAFRIYYS